MMKVSKKKKLWVRVFTIFIVQLSLLPRNCDCQFHWGKNYRLETKQLRNMFSRAATQKYSESESMPTIKVS